MGTTVRWVHLFAILQALLTACQASPAPRGRPGQPGPSILRPLLLDSEQGLGSLSSLGSLGSLGQGLGLGVVDDGALMELDQLLNLIQSKGKRNQEQADKGLTRDLVTQVLQPGGAGMWFGPRLGRRRRRAVEVEAGGPARGSRDLHELQMDAEVDNDIAWRLSELVRELQGPKRSHCDPYEINCLLANIAESQQRPRSEGNLVNFTPRLGRDSGEDASPPSSAGGGGIGGIGGIAGIARQLRTDVSNPRWFSPRLGRRLLPPGTLDVHAHASFPPTASSWPDHARETRGVEEKASEDGEEGDHSKDGHTHL